MAVRGFVPARVGPRNGFHRRQSQSGMIAAYAVEVQSCGNCGVSVPAADSLEGWCLPCVVTWGHPDDGAEAFQLLHGWTQESAAAALRHVATNVDPVQLAVRSFGVVDLSTAEKLGVGRMNVDSRRCATAGDGFLYDDEPSVKRNGRLPHDLHIHFKTAVLRLLDSGFSIRAITRVTGLSRITVRAYRRGGAKAYVCECGEVSTHQGWCAPRFRASKRRQEFMSRWHPGVKWTCEPGDGFRVAWAEQ